MLTRRELMAKGLEVLLVVGFGHLVFRYAGWAGASSLLVSFDREPGEGEVLFREGVFLVGLQGGPVALSARCPHLGCQLAFDPKGGRFNCPCHGSQFTLLGERIKGPARRGMTKLSLSREKRQGRLTATLEVP